MKTDSSAPPVVGTDASSASRHVEVERKFKVVDSTVTPSFDSLSVVASVHRCPPVTLDAVYFDTPGCDLAAHRLTLRRRTGGADAGWHLKLPAGPDTRTEIRTPLGIGGDGDGDDQVPESLRDVARAIVRDRPLAPVARITTNRTVEVLYAADGAALAEFCDDQVTSRVTGHDTEQRWREWELELAESAVAAGTADEALLARLSETLCDAGAQPATSTSKLAHALGSTGTRVTPDRTDSVHRAVTEQLQELLVWDRAVRADVDDSVHEMRVTLRTIRSLLQASAPVFGLSENAWVIDELRELATVLGLARDAEVLADRYQRALDELPAPLVRGPVRQRLVDGARQQYRLGLEKSLSTMRSQRYFTLLDALDALVTAEPLAPPTGEKKTEKARIKAEYKRICKRAKAVAAASPQHRDTALHDVRKGAKRLRYTAAAAGMNKVVLAAKDVQTVLGDHQDGVVSRAHLTEQVDDAHQAGEDTFTYGVLYERETMLAQRDEQRLDGALHALDTAVRKALRS